MSFEIVSQRELTDEEIGLMRRASALLGNRCNRRELLKLTGMTGAVFVASFVPIGSARALVPVIIRAVSVLGRVALQSAIPATITLYNSNALAAKGQIAVEHKEPTGLIAAQDVGSVAVAPETETVIRHSRFEARMVGDNEYIAYSDLNSEEDIFEVIS